MSTDVLEATRGQGLEQRLLAVVDRYARVVSDRPWVDERDR